MRLYQFKNSARNIDVTVVTDGSDDQRKVFITETPRNIPIPGNTSFPEDDPNAAVLGMGFDFFAGVAKHHMDFVLFAVNNGLQLIQWNEGLGEVSPIEVVPEDLTLEYNLSVEPTSLYFEAEGGSQALDITSTKTVTTEGPLKGLVLPVSFSAVITAPSAMVFVPGKNIVRAPEYTESSFSNGTLVLTQLEPATGAKTVTVTLAQGSGEEERPGEL